MHKGKGLIRSNNRRGVESGKERETIVEHAVSRVALRGPYVAAHEADIRRRLENVVEAAGGAPQARDRIVSIERDDKGLAVVTTTQELAHRIVHEMKKAFHGEASYTWSDGDGSLFAVWEREA